MRKIWVFATIPIVPLAVSLSVVHAQEAVRAPGRPSRQAPSSQKPVVGNTTGTSPGAAKVQGPRGAGKPIGTVFTQTAVASPTPAPSSSPSPVSSPLPVNPPPVPNSGAAVGTSVPSIGQPGAVPGTVPPPPGGGAPPPMMQPPMAGPMSPWMNPPPPSSSRPPHSSAIRDVVCHTNMSSACNCSNVGRIEAPIREAQEFHRLCVSQSVLGSSSGQLMAINDYRGRVGCMYLINVQTGQCDYATTSDYGTGSGSPPRPGCVSNSRMTPAGFHVTRPHRDPNGSARYDSRNSLVMASLQGQGSAGRGILIHQGGCNGGAATWGCAGVGDYPTVREKLGPQGSLIYNYFGDEVGDCSGARNKNSCRREGGGSAPSISRPETPTS